MTTTPSPATEASVANDSPALLIIDLRDEDHITFVKTYQERFDTYRLNLPLQKYGAQKRWIRKNLMGEFQRKFGAVSKGFVDKVDRYLRNHSAHRTKTPPSPVVALPSPRAVSWIHVMGLDKKETIDSRAAALRAAEGVTSRADHLHYFRRARQEVADSLSETEVNEYKAQAEAETQARKTPPTPEAVFDRQPSITNRVSSAIQKNFGWEVGQLGDVLCFFAVAYRNKDNSITTQFTLNSNQCIPADEMIIPVMSQDFNEYVNPSLKVLAQKYLPRLDNHQPQLNIDIDEMSPKALRQAVLNHITASWAASGTSSECRTPENIPWKEFDTPEGHARYINTLLDFSQGFFCPMTVMSHDTLYMFATKLISFHHVPLFNPPSAYLSPPNSTCRTPDARITDNEQEAPRDSEPAAQPSLSQSPSASAEPLPNIDRPFFRSAPPPQFEPVPDHPTPNPPAPPAPPVNMDTPTHKGVTDNTASTPNHVPVPPVLPQITSTTPATENSDTHEKAGQGPLADNDVSSSESTEVPTPDKAGEQLEQDKAASTEVPVPDGARKQLKKGKAAATGNQGLGKRKRAAAPVSQPSDRRLRARITTTEQSAPAPATRKGASRQKKNTQKKK